MAMLVANLLDTVHHQGGIIVRHTEAAVLLRPGAVPRVAVLQEAEHREVGQRHREGGRHLRVYKEPRRGSHRLHTAGQGHQKIVRVRQGPVLLLRHPLAGLRLQRSAGKVLIHVLLAPDLRAPKRVNVREVRRHAHRLQEETKNKGWMSKFNQRWERTSFNLTRRQPI